MSVGDVAKIIGSIYYLKQLYNDVEGNKEDCQYLIARCSALQKPLEAIRLNEEKLLSCQEALVALQAVLDDCIKFCKKYTGKRWFVKAYRNMHCGDKEKFAELNSRISSSSSDLQLGVNLDSISGVSDGITNLRSHMGEDMTEIKARMAELTNMVHDLLQSKSADPQHRVSSEAIAVAIRNSQRLVRVSEELDDLDSENVNFLEPPPTPSSSAGSDKLPNSSAKTKVLHSSKMNDSSLPIDHSQLLWIKDRSTLLGAGTFGAVYKCEYLHTPCAVKHFACLTQQLPTTRELMKIKREARILQLASFHPNIIGYRGVDLEQGLLLMELASCSLFDILHREGKRSALPIESHNLELMHTFKWKVHLLIDIIGALSFLHFHGVLHRDIKTANIMLVFDQSRVASTGLPLMAKLSDFGLASAVGLSSSGQSVATRVEGNAVGSTAYMSPELLDFEHTPQYAPAADVYAFGIVANELFIEQIPWAGLRDIHVLNLVVNKHQRPVRLAPADALEKVTVELVVGDHVSGALHQDPALRASANALSTRLYEYLSFVAQNEKSVNEKKVVPRPTLIKQIAQALFPTIADDEILEEDAFDTVEVVDHVEVAEPAEVTTVVSDATTAVEQPSSTEPTKHSERFEKEATASFSPYPEPPELQSSVSFGSGLDDSNKSVHSEPSPRPPATPSTNAKPVKPVKPKSLKAAIAQLSPPAASSVPVPLAYPEIPGHVVVEADLSLSDVSASSKAETDAVAQHVSDLIASLTTSAREATRIEALRELSVIVQENSAKQSLVASLGAIPPTVDLLTAGSSSEQVQAAALLAYLAKNNFVNQSDIAGRGVLQTLVHILTQSAQDENKESAASALMFLIFNHPENQLALYQLNALSAVVLFVAQGPHTFQGVSEALRVLTDIAESHRDFVSIVAVLQYGPYPLQIRMAQEMVILSEDNLENKDAFGATDCMNILLTHLSEGSEDLVEHSTHALKCLATKHPKNREAIVTAGGITLLVEVVATGTAAARVSAMNLLHAISSHSPTHRATIAASGVIDKLKAIRENNMTANQVKQAADYLLKELTQRSSFTVPAFLSQFTHAK